MKTPKSHENPLDMLMQAQRARQTFKNIRNHNKNALAMLMQVQNATRHIDRKLQRSFNR